MSFSVQASTSQIENSFLNSAEELDRGNIEKNLLWEIKLLFSRRAKNDTKLASHSASKLPVLLNHFSIKHNNGHIFELGKRALQYLSQNLKYEDILSDAIEHDPNFPPWAPITFTSEMRHVCNLLAKSIFTPREENYTSFPENAYASKLWDRIEALIHAVNRGESTLLEKLKELFCEFQSTSKIDLDFSCYDFVYELLFIPIDSVRNSLEKTSNLIELHLFIKSLLKHFWEQHDEDIIIELVFKEGSWSSAPEILLEYLLDSLISVEGKLRDTTHSWLRILVGRIFTKFEHNKSKCTDILKCIERKKLPQDTLNIISEACKEYVQKETDELKTASLFLHAYVT